MKLILLKTHSIRVGFGFYKIFQTPFIFFRKRTSNEIWNFVSKYNRQGLIDCETVSLKETIAHANRELVKIINILGQEVKFRNIENGEILFKIYDNGSVEKLFK